MPLGFPEVRSRQSQERTGEGPITVLGETLLALRPPGAREEWYCDIGFIQGTALPVDSWALYKYELLY